MAGILGPGDFAKSFSAVQSAAARPNFELSFSILQNALIDQLNVKIEEVQQQNTNKVDAFLTLEKKKLSRALAAVGSFGNQTQHNRDILTEILDKVETVVTATENNDEQTFNSNMADIEDLMANNIKDVSGAAAGLNVKDRFYQYRENGSGIDSYADYATDQDRSDAVLALQGNLLRIFSVMEINRDTAYSISTDIQSRLTAIDIQINADQMAQQQESLQEIETLKKDHGRFLTYLSIAFEVNQGAAEQLAASIQQTNTQKGTVVDIIS